MGHTTETVRALTSGEDAQVELADLLRRVAEFTEHLSVMDVLLTEDQGILLGVDDCPCGCKGRYFRFTSRIERAAIRGCGDTFAQSRELR